MLRVLAFSFVLLLIARTGYAQASPPGRPEAAGPLPDEHIVYKITEQDSLRLHVFYPETRGEAVPAIVFFFGGGWVGGRPEQFYPQARHLATRGMVAISAEYRVRDVHSTTPFESVRDGVSAMRWVRAHAADLGIDPGRIAAGGGSAGGHIAAATALLNGYDEPDADTTIRARPDALVLFNPVIDNGPDGYGYERIGSRYPDFSPLHNIDAHAPPTLFLLGTEDALVPVSTAREFQRLMQEADVRCDVVLYEGQAHGFFNLREGNPYYKQTLQATERFLESLRYLPE